MISHSSRLPSNSLSTPITSPALFTSRSTRSEEEVRRALDALAEAADSLDSAKRWGIVDILGGGLITSVIKHSRLGDANHALARAREEIRAFTREISDVRDLHLLNAEVGGLNAFFDIAMDNTLVDLLVQKDISDAEDRVEEATAWVREAIARLEAAR